MVKGRLAVAVFMSLALVLGACGNEGDDDDAASDDTEEPTDGTDAPAGEADDTGDDTAEEDPFADLVRIEAPDPCVNDPGVSDTEIKVGVIAPQTGAGAQSFAPALDGLRARIDQGNADGEFGDRTVTLVERDDATDATRNAEVARELIESENVFAVVSLTDQADGSAEYLAENDVPVVGWHVGRPVWSQNPNMFTFRQGPAANFDSEYTTRSSELFVELGASKIALIGGGNQASAAFVDRVGRSLEAIGDVEVVYETANIPREQTDFTAEVERIESSGADGIVTGMDFLQNTALSDALAQAGVDMKAVVFPGGYDPRVLAVPGVEGAVFSLEFIPFEANPPAFEAFDAAMPDGAVRSQITYIGWLSGEILVEGIEQAGVSCPTREAFITNLRLVDDYDGGGAFEPTDLSADYGKEFRCAYYVRVEGGAFVPLFDAEPFCGEPIDI